MVWLIVARAVQGIGGGGMSVLRLVATPIELTVCQAIIQMCNIVVGDITPLDQRGKYLGYLGATWGIASYVF